MIIWFLFFAGTQVPYVAMRGFVAMMGSLTVPIIFGIMRESGYPIVVSAFSACLVLFGVYPLPSYQDR